MSALSRLDTRSDALRDAFPDMFRRFMRMTDWPATRMADDMRLDVVENDKEYQIRAEIPGAKKEDIHVNVQGNYVTIDAEVKSEKKESRKGNGERILLQEMHYGSSSRRFALPQEVDLKNANAHFENGVLSLTLPKAEPSAGSSIKVQ